MEPHARTACVHKLAGSHAVNQEDLDMLLPPQHDAAMQLWARVQRICRDAVMDAQDALGPSGVWQAAAEADQESKGDDAFGYVLIGILVGAVCPGWQGIATQGPSPPPTTQGSLSRCVC